MANRIGQQFGNYRLIRLLGSGGFAEVYLGEHKELGAQAAIKILQTDLLIGENEKFRIEARTIAKLIHPHIVRVFDYGVEGSTPFMVMDYAPGGTLKDRHSTGVQLSLPTVASYVKQVADALQYAHAEKIIHRDIKPANILVGRHNEILLSDFGIAVIAHNTHSMILQDKKGTLAYMAPEQLQGKPTVASDQYALGIVVYEWLCGEVPFKGTVIEILTQHLSVQPTPLRTKIPTISPAVEQVVLTALAKNPQQRFANVQEFADALEQASVSSQATTTILPAKQSLPTIEPTILAAPQPKSLDPDALYREGVLARSKGDLPNLELAASLWQQILDQDPNYGNGTLATQMQRLLQELHPLRVQRLRQQAVQASRTGKWDQEINLWNTLLGLEPQDTQAKERIPIAEHNQKYAWRYENAQQLLKEGRPDAARTVLQELWQDAPYYGDPAELAEKVRIQVPPSYEVTKTITQRSERRHQFISKFLPAGSLLACFFIVCLLAGLGFTFGVLTQSWLWATVTVCLTAILSYISAYRKEVNLTSMVCTTMIGLAIALLGIWLVPPYHYNQFQVDHFWLLGDRKMILVNQLFFGLIFNLSYSLLASLLAFMYAVDDEFGLAGTIGFIFLYGLVLSLFIWLPVALLSTAFGWGFGFGFGWELAFSMGPVLGFFNSIGVGAWVRVLIVGLNH